MSKTKNSIRSNKGNFMKQEHDNLSSCTSSSLSSDEEEIDVRDLKPIKDYLSNRKELARQLFKSVKPEKIRMMLPQVLKMDLNELEEWCVSELNGMSKARIISILNGKPMLESSDTNESDDSGPSLEIISDTEEWTDDDTSKKENGKGKVKRDKTKGKAKVNKKNNLDKPNVKVRCNIKNEINDKNKEVEIKKEDDKKDDKDKGKEGDSLLDLLELEMRARAIRALIRKEEDIIPSSNLSQTSNGQTVKNNVEATQDDAKAKEKCRKQLERIISAQQSNKGEDEDVVLVIQPTPIVELLSSDSEMEDADGARMNKKSENARATGTGKAENNSNENARNSSKTSSYDSKERRGIQEAGEHNDSNTVTKIDLSEARTIMPERNVDIRNNTLSISISADNVAERRKKSKKRSQKQNAKVISTENPRLKQINTSKTSEQSSDVKIKEQSKANSPIENKVAAKEENRSSEKVTKESKIEEDRLADLDEIIDLDDYCDVMDIVSGDDEKSQDKIIVSSQQENKQSALQAIVPKVGSTETWASRYYQTDDVQNVIKESKIQSEIRKRLRERQRLSKLSKSPNLNLPSQSTTVDGTNNAPEKVPTGSVEEYLALKRAGIANVSNNTNNNNSDNNNTTQDISTTVNCSSDVDIKKSLVQDENISSVQECTDNINNVQKTIASLPGAITETKNDAQTM